MKFIFSQIFLNEKWEAKFAYSPQCNVPHSSLSFDEAWSSLNVRSEGSRKAWTCLIDRSCRLYKNYIPANANFEPTSRFKPVTVVPDMPKAWEAFCWFVLVLFFCCHGILDSLRVTLISGTCQPVDHNCRLGCYFFATVHRRQINSVQNVLKVVATYEVIGIVDLRKLAWCMRKDVGYFNQLNLIIQL